LKRLRLDRQSHSWTAGAIVVLTLLAPALAGTTEFWAQALVILLTGLLLVIAPPQKSLGWLPNVCFVALLLLSGTAFLPAKWFPPDDWRTALSNFGISLPQTNSPQPWITLQAGLLCMLGIAWMYRLLSFEWHRGWRERAWLTYAVAMLGLASALIIAFVLKARIPFWPDVQEFGFFPNRNQTSNVLGLGGVMIYALGLQRFQQGRKNWWLWFVSLAIICWALIINYSRAGIILFFFGALAVHIYWWSATRERRRPLVAFGGLALLVALFIMDGGATLMRFGRETAGFFSPTENFRLNIYRDAFALIDKAPWLGIGLGNFPAIFSLGRHYSSNSQTVSIHPESDWLWVAAELGWIAPFLLFLLLAWWIKRCFPFGPGTFRLMRVAAMTCGIALAIHGMFDVSGHRIGALWPALFLASIAVRSNGNHRSSPVVTRLFQVLGLAFLCVGIWWLASIFGARTFPTTATLDRLDKKIDEAAARDDYSAILDSASQALRVAPLDWSVYFQRARAEASLFNFKADAVRDFAVARYLLPDWPQLCFQEGEVWLAVDEPDRAFEAWAEALRRSAPRASDFYSRMFESVKSNAELVDRWRNLGRSNRDLLMIYLANARPVEFAMEADELLSEDPQLRSLSQSQLGTLFTAWYQKGDKLALAELLRNNPKWQQSQWRLLARIYADYQDYRQAYETARKFDPLPEIPEQNSNEPLAMAATRFQANRTDVASGLALYIAQLREGQTDAALVTLQKLIALPGSPKYLSYLEAQLWAQHGDWQKAWQARARAGFGSD
jgi:O-antigen ligase